MAEEDTNKAADSPDAGGVTEDTGPAAEDAGGSGVDATPGLGGVGAGDPGGVDPQAPIVNDENASGPTA